MPTFKDNAGREWTIAIDAPSIMRIREDCDPKFLLHDSDESNTYARLQQDPVLLSRVIFLLCADQRSKLAIADDAFYTGIIGDAIDSATEAMLQAILSFTPRRTRELLEVCAAKDGKLRQIMTQRALEVLNDPALETTALAKFETELADIMGEALNAALECYKLAGFVGISACGLTLRTLTWMATGRAEMLGLMDGEKNRAQFVDCDYETFMRM